MKLLGTIVLLTIALWATPVFAEYCERNPATNLISCKYVDTHGKPHNATITITLTREGYSMVITVYVDEWLMLGGESTVTIGEAEPQEIQYLGTRRDITEGGLLMEAGVYMVDKELLEKMHQSKGTILFKLEAEEDDELVIEFWSRRFKKLGDFINETQAILNPE